MSWSRIPRMSKLLCLLTLLYVAPAWAADGDVCPAFIAKQIGDYRSFCLLLCDGDKSAASTCPELDMAVDLQAGYPLFYTIAIVKETGCSGTPDIIPRGLHRTSGPTHDLVRTSLSTADDSSQTFPISYPIIDAAISDVAGCTDLEVAVIFWHSR